MTLNKDNIYVKITTEADIKKAKKILISNDEEIIEPFFDLTDSDIKGVHYLIYSQSINKWWINWHFSALKYKVTFSDLETILINNKNTTYDINRIN